jgi:crossover junction endodeoxyribonuclease RusA
MTDEWVLRLPFDKPISLNDRMHHMVRSKRMKEWRTASALLIRQAKIPPMGIVQPTLVYHPAQRRRRDPDNLVLAYKAVVDGFVDAGVIPDDTQEYVDRVWPIIGDTVKVSPEGRFELIVKRIE